MKFVYLTLVLSLNLVNCSESGGMLASKASVYIKHEQAPISLSYQAPQSMNLERPNANSSTFIEALKLGITPTNLIVNIHGCASGYSQSAVKISSGMVNLYKGDRGCLVKLQSFTYGNTTYSPNGVNAVPFTTWLEGDTAIYQSISSETDLIKVSIEKQISSVFNLNDRIIYNFTEIQGNALNLTPLTTLFNPVLVSESKDASNFHIVQARYVSTNSNGSAKFSFTLSCADKCDINSLSSMEYAFIDDTYEQEKLSLSELNSIFQEATAHKVATNLIAAGTKDPYFNTLSKGGFYTNELTANSMNSLFILKNGTSYFYFYVNISGFNQL